MKVIVNKDTGSVRYVEEDTANVVVLSDKLVLPTRVDTGLNSRNVIIYPNRTDVPADFVPGKYMFDGDTWIPCPDYRTREQKEAADRAADVASKKVPKYRH